MPKTDTFTVRRRTGDSFDGKQGLDVTSAILFFDAWVQETHPDNTTIQLVDETSSAAVLTLRYSEKDKDWKVQR